MTEHILCHFRKGGAKPLCSSRNVKIVRTTFFIDVLDATVSTNNDQFLGTGVIHAVEIVRYCVDEERGRVPELSHKVPSNFRAFLHRTMRPNLGGSIHVPDVGCMCLAQIDRREIRDMTVTNVQLLPFVTRVAPAGSRVTAGLYK